MAAPSENFEGQLLKNAATWQTLKFINGMAVYCLVGVRGPLQVHHLHLSWILLTLLSTTTFWGWKFFLWGTLSVLLYTMKYPFIFFLLFSATRRYKHQNKVRVKGLGKNSSYLAGFLFFFMVLWKSSNSWLKQKTTQIFFLSHKN